MAIRNGKLERLIEVPTGDYTLTLTETGGVTGQAVTAAAGETSFLSSAYTGTGGTGNSFLAQLQADLTTIGHEYAVTIGAGEDGTGKVTIDRTGSSNFAVVWTSTELRDLLGFSQGNLTGANAYTGASQAQGLWLPNAPMNSLFGASDKGFYETDAMATESPSGAVKAFFANKKQVNQIRWAGVSHAKCRASAEATPNESFEQFWLDCILGEKAWAAGPCGPIRVYWDAGDNATYADYKVVGNAMRGFNPAKLEEGWLGLWEVGLDRMVVI
jgi:hypothetical protein